MTEREQPVEEKPAEDVAVATRTESSRKVVTVTNTTRQSAGATLTMSLPRLSDDDPLVEVEVQL